MAKYFTLYELTHSETAYRLGIDNTPPPNTTKRLETLIERLLDPLRELWRAPVYINSSYRCPALNDAVGGVATSQHLFGEAADITTGTCFGNRRLFETIIAASTDKTTGIDFDQLIDERDYSWLHISYRAGANRRQILHL